MISPRKNGLPCVRCISVATAPSDESIPWDATRSATAAESSPTRSIRVTPALTTQVGQRFAEAAANRGIDRSIGREEPDPGVVRLRGEEREQFQRGLIGPVEVIDDDDQRCLSGKSRVSAVKDS